MACYHPIELPWLPTAVPCGTCIGCRGDQAREWSIRIMNETQMHEHAWFLTLTYNDESIPQHGSLAPQHLRKFFKDLRRNEPAQSVSYYACGEYGTLTKRPHYHAVLYGPAFLDRDLWRGSGRTRLWRSESLESTWPHGHAEFGAVTHAAASYVAGYVQKKLTKKQNPDAYLRVDQDTGELVELVPEFSRMSLKPAIGKRWIEKYWKEVYTHDRLVVDGKEYKPPRYYDKWMEEHHPEELFRVKIKRDQEATYVPPDKNQIKEKIHRARNALFNQRNKI